MKSLIRAVLIFVPLGMLSLARAQVIYDLTQPSPPVAFANTDPGVVMFDDVLIPLDRLGGQTTLSVKKATTLIYVPIAGTYRVTAWAAKGRITNGMLQPDGIVQLQSQPFTFPDSNTLYSITVGNGTTEAFSVPLLPFTFEGNSFRMFFYGLSFDQPLQNVGWTLANGPDTNLDGFYAYYGAGSSQNGARILSGFRASFNLKVEGAPVPEPASALALVLGIAGSRRRRKRT